MSDFKPLRECLDELGPDYQSKKTYELVRGFLRDHLVSDQNVVCLPKRLIQFRRAAGSQRTTGHRFLMPDSETLLINLLCLLSLLEPRHVADVLLGRGEAEMIDAVFHDIEKRSEIFTRILNAQTSVRERLISGSLQIDTAPLLSEARPSSTPITTQPASPETTNLVAGALHLYHLDKIAAEAPTAGAHAERAFHLLQIGSMAIAREAAEHAFKLDPTEPMALAMKAILLLTESSLARSHAAQMQFTLNEAPDLGDSALAGLEMEVAGAVGAAQSHRERALPLLVRALRCWPRSEGRVEMRDLHDMVMRETLALIWTTRGQIKGLVQQGVLVADDVVHLLREDEADADRMCDLSRWSSRASDDLRRLSLFRIVDDTQFRRFAKVWLCRLPDYDAEQTLSILRRPEFVENLRELVPSKTSEILVSMRTKLRAWVDGEVRRAESAVALADFRAHSEAGRYAEAVEVATFGCLDITGEPPLGLLYGSLRATHDLLAEAKVDSAGKFLAAHGQGLVESIRRISEVDRREYLTLIYDDDDEYRDVLGREADLLPSDGRQDIPGDHRGKLANLLESLLPAQRNRPAAKQIRAILKALEGQPCGTPRSRRL